MIDATDVGHIANILLWMKEIYVWGFVVPILVLPILFGAFKWVSGRSPTVGERRPDGTIKGLTSKLDEHRDSDNFNPSAEFAGVVIALAVGVGWYLGSGMLFLVYVFIKSLLTGNAPSADPTLYILAGTGLFLGIFVQDRVRELANRPV